MTVITPEKITQPREPHASVGGLREVRGTTPGSHFFAQLARGSSSLHRLTYRQPIDRVLVQINPKLTTLAVRLNHLARFQTCNDG